LAGKTSAQYFGVFVFTAVKCSDVIVLWYFRPMFLQYPPTVRINLHLPRTLHSGPIKPKVKSTDT
jgi:hypothetical protein